MSDPGVSNGTEFDGPVEFRVIVRGHLGERGRNRVGGLRISIGEDQDGKPRTELTGLLQDQAALMGLLQHLYARGVPLVSVEQVKRRKSNES